MGSFTKLPSDSGWGRKHLEMAEGLAHNLVSGTLTDNHQTRELETAALWAPCLYVVAHMVSAAQDLLLVGSWPHR
jgi:hypothetical protein